MEKSALKVHSGTIDITPNFEARLSGFASRNKKVKEIHCGLEANLVVFIENPNVVKIILTIDTLFVVAPLYSYIFGIFEQIYPGLSSGDLTVCASHTHYAPSLENIRHDLGEIDEQYFEFLKSKLSTLIQDTTATQASPCLISFSNGHSRNLTANRRRTIRNFRKGFKKEVVMEPNLGGEKNEILSLFKIINSDKQTVEAIIWHYTCHPTNLPENEFISAEFPGIVRNDFRNRRNSPHIPVLFLQGFSGDIRAFPPKRNIFLNSIYTLLLQSYPTAFYKFQWSEYQNWTANLSNEFEKVFQSNSCEIQNLDLSSAEHQLPISTLGIAVEGIDNLSLKYLRLADKIVFVFISAEVLIHYQTIVEQIWEGETVIAVGYIENVFGYLPSGKEISEGGYESQDFFSMFKVKGQFVHNPEIYIKKCLKQMKSAS